jgi:hypothetical protein
MKAPHSRRWANVRRIAVQRNQPSSLIFIARASHGEFYPQLSRMRHAKWLQNPYEYTPTQTGSVICCPLEAVDIERRPPRAGQLSKRAKKLRAVSGACPRRSPNWQHCRGRELLPVRGTLFQIDVLEFRKNVRSFPAAATSARANVDDNGEHVASRSVWCPRQDGGRLTRALPLSKVATLAASLSPPLLRRRQAARCKASFLMEVISVINSALRTALLRKADAHLGWPVQTSNIIRRRKRKRRRSHDHPRKSAKISFSRDSAYE